jgi:hypothetical protein
MDTKSLIRLLVQSMSRNKESITPSIDPPGPSSEPSDQVVPLEHPLLKRVEQGRYVVSEANRMSIRSPIF